MDAKNKQTVNFKIIGVNEVAFSGKDLTEQEISDFQENNLRVGFGYRFHFKEKDEKIGLGLLIDYKYNDVDIIKFEIIVWFQVSPFNTFIKKEQNQVNIDDGLLSNFLSLSIGIARGMLIEKNKGKFIGSTILPLIDTQKLLQAQKEKRK